MIFRVLFFIVSFCLTLSVASAQSSCNINSSILRKTNNVTYLGKERIYTEYREGYILDTILLNDSIFSEIVIRAYKSYDLSFSGIFFDFTFITKLSEIQAYRNLGFLCSKEITKGMFNNLGVITLITEDGDVIGFKFDDDSIGSDKLRPDNNGNYSIYKLKFNDSYTNTSSPVTMLNKGILKLNIGCSYSDYSIRLKG